MKRSLIERFIKNPYTINIMLGGMIMPTVPPAATVAAAKCLSYPPLVISGCMIEPIVAVVAELEPEMAANKPHAPSADMASPPRNQPNIL